METVQLQCGSCSNMMAISVEHLGAQVQCPHCAAVVQTPPRSALGGPPPGPDPYGAAVQPPAPPPPPPAPPPPPNYPPVNYSEPRIQVPERESIFSEPEPSDDLFDEGSAAPKVMMPENAAVDVADVEQTEDIEDEEQVDLTAMRSRVAAERKSSSFAPTLLVFLVPYAIFTSAFIGYLLYMWPKIERFDYLPDPSKKNQPRVVFLPAHDLPMPAKNTVALNQPIRVGHMEITPLSVTRKGDDELTLEFKAKNVSTNQMICPIDYDFFRDATPYTFLEQIGGPVAIQGDGKQKGVRVYGGDLDGEPTLLPNEEKIIRLSTDVGKTTQSRVRSLIAQEGKYLWRLQVRRGLTPIHNGELSMTAVVGVEFAYNDIK